MSLQTPDKNTVIDAETFAELMSLQESTHPTFVQELVDLFISTSHESLQRMDEVLKSGDVKTLSDIAHGMKSSAANLGATALSKLCFELESKESEPSITPEMGLLVTYIRQAFQEAETALRQRLSAG